ncbi:hypothetical protein SAMD00019534_077260 [Acytostelium subglobosum LB1]|uniref:hypothetical protein n=1 Tax=Acytostelium subglobosum LB1 TaxID=1410327 RepID=UPI000644DB2C|nr:hypothetical protein SAMD00019534_077260 [Acytostelium subglobosum LB1]GAM24551.1 hypothetical protein SAMD00019534_077260 [Acytostelium subglobosum LB1]|eukprot:XP_012752220.1 hypothetical protein SAMD00019534_077260 [Acytostelium subglobosum LB1]
MELYRRLLGWSSRARQYTPLDSTQQHQQDPVNVTEEVERDSLFDQPCPEQHASLLSRLSFFWVQPMMMTGYKKAPLLLTDLWRAPEHIKVENTVQYLDNLHLDCKYALIRHIYREFVLRNVTLIIIKIFGAMVTIGSPVLLKTFLWYIQNDDFQKGYGWLLSFGLFLTSISLSLTNQYSFWFGMKMCLEIRGSLIATIFRKMLRINNDSRRRFNCGAIMNLVAVDVESFSEFFWNNCIDIFIYPFTITMLLVFLCMVVGVAPGLVGFILMVIGLPSNALLSKRQSDHQLNAMNIGDERVGLIGEMLEGIRLLKLYAWELPFINRVMSVRERQIHAIKKRNVFWATSSLLTQVLAGVVLFSTFMVYTLLGNQLTATVAFTSLTIFVNMRRPLEMLPESIQRLMKIMASAQRIESFLRCSEVQASMLSYQDNDKDVQIINGEFSWDSTSSASTLNQGHEEEEEEDDDNDDTIQSPDEADIKASLFKKQSSIELENITKHQSTSVLKQINIVAPAGKLTMVCGRVGVGKTSILSALIGEIHKVDGQVQVPRRIGFTSQTAFLISASLRDNILFGQDFDQDRYIKVLQACALDSDLGQLPAKDLTEIGERGLNLSGGQKQRVSLARAVYSDPDCYILDEPLSAVDSEVAKHLLQHCIQGVMANRTRILVTHQLQFLPAADHIIVVGPSGEITQGSYQELVDSGIDFESIMKNKYGDMQKSLQQQQQRQQESDVDSITTSTTTELPRAPLPTTPVQSIHDLIASTNEPNLEQKAKLLVQEERNKGAIGLDTYGPYVKAGGVIGFSIIVFFYITSQVIFQSADYWLVVWTKRQLSTPHTDRWYLMIYFCFIVVYIIMLGIRYFALSRFTVVASSSLHNRLLTNVIDAPTLFFDQNPSGRILNRFSKDISDIDISLLDVISDIMYNGSSVLVSICIMIFINPIMVLPLACLGVLYYFVQQIYRSSSRELKRMESISRSPIFSTFGESYNGLVTIRSFKQQTRFYNQLIEQLDVNIRLIYYSYACHRWMGTRLEFIASVTVFFSSLFSVYNAADNPGLAGLAVTSALGMTGFLNRLVRQFTTLEVKMNSVERVNTYIQTPSEGVRYSDAHSAPPEDWPQEGKIEFRSVQVRYRPNMEPSLSNVTALIHPNEKIGIVGRTGAGKSTIGVVLFRMVNPSAGEILIDDLNIVDIGLYDLRSRLSVIPQEPFIFSGTLRDNIDPAKVYSDEQIWSSLEKVQMKPVISGMPMALSTPVDRGGDTFSTGQKQLLCLCRALLRNSKIVLMDEATASLDYHTDSIIKETIANNFKNSTVLTIAHRLDTIYDSDRIIVVDKGRLAEFESPELLARNPDSRYTQLLVAQSSYSTSQ